MRSVVNSCFVTFVPPSIGLTSAIYYTLYGLCQRKPLDGGTYATKKQLIFGFALLLSVQVSIAHSILFYESLRAESTSLFRVGKKNYIFLLFSQGFSNFFFGYNYEYFFNFTYNLALVLKQA